jgi:hypothetical protein
VLLVDTESAVPSHGRTPSAGQSNGLSVTREVAVPPHRNKHVAAAHTPSRYEFGSSEESTKLAKRFHSTGSRRLHHHDLTERSSTEESSLICAHNLYDALPRVYDAPTEPASLRYGTGFCASFAPEQVHLCQCCRQRPRTGHCRCRGTVTRTLASIGTWWPLDSDSVELASS